MSDILYDAAVEYEKLRKVVYKSLLGGKDIRIL